MLFFGLLPDKEYGSIAFGLKELKEKLKTKLNSVCVCVCVCVCACVRACVCYTDFVLVGDFQWK